MGLEQDYVEYAVELSLAMLGVSASYFINPANPITFLSLLFLPVLYGYTAYISREGFNKTSLITLITAVFGIVGGVTALIAIVYSIGNIFVSIFSGGERFKDFYGSTSLPLILTGLIIGLSVFGYASADPEFKQQTVEMAGEHMAEMTQRTVEDSGLVEGEKDSQMRIVNSTSKASTRLTVQKVYNETQPSMEVANALEEAREEVPMTVYRTTKEQMDNQEVDMSGRIESMFNNTFSGSRFVMVIPLLAGLIYSLQPLLGVLTAIFAKVFLRIGS